MVVPERQPSDFLRFALLVGEMDTAWQGLAVRIVDCNIESTGRGGAHQGNVARDRRAED
jgi:hypothetical protein